jgi:hypothetical protein
MLNNSEVIASWYLRLNGFFLLDNFVLHWPLETVHASDVDILAIRHPHVFEVIGGLLDDWDVKTGGIFDSSHPLWEVHKPFTKTIGIYAEVKGGTYTTNELDEKFEEERMLYGIRRIGFFPQGKGTETTKRRVKKTVYTGEKTRPSKSPAEISILQSLREKGWYAHPRTFCLLNVVFTERKAKPGPYLNISLDHARAYIRAKARKWGKSAWAEHFKNPLIQEFLRNADKT